MRHHFRQVNRHNFHYYDKENPYFHRNVDHQYRQTVNVWGGIIGDHVIGPHFFDDTLTGQIYLEFLRDSLPPMLDDIPIDIRRAMRFCTFHKRLEESSRSELS